MPNSKRLLESELNAWFHHQFKEFFYEENAPIEQMTKIMIKKFLDAESCSVLISSIIKMQIKLLSKEETSISKEVQHKLLKRRVCHFLKNTIRRQYENFKKEKYNLNFEAGSEDSKESIQNETSPSLEYVGSNKGNQCVSFGHLLYGDKICRIADICLNNLFKLDELVALIEWKPRRNGIIPRSSLLQLEDILYYKPNCFQDSSIFVSDLVKEKIKILLSKKSRRLNR